MIPDKHLINYRTICEKMDRPHLNYLNERGKKARGIHKILRKCDLTFEFQRNPYGAPVVLYRYLKTMILFPNKDVNHVLEKAGYRETLLRWFVPIKNLRLELKKLNRENLVLEGFALKNIEHYLLSKMTVDFLKQTARITNQKEQEGNLYNAVERVYRRRKNTPLGKTIRIDNLDDAVVNFQFVVLEEEFQKHYPASYRLKAKKKLRSLYLLKVQHEELLTLINTIFPIKQKSQTDWFLSLKDLFSLFALEEKWTKEAFENEKSLYENNFNKYIALKIKKLSGFKGSKHDPSQFLFRLGKPA